MAGLVYSGKAFSRLDEQQLLSFGEHEKERRDASRHRTTSTCRLWNTVQYHLILTPGIEVAAGKRQALAKREGPGPASTSATQPNNDPIVQG